MKGVSSALSSLNVATSQVRVWWDRELTDPLSVSGLLLINSYRTIKTTLGLRERKRRRLSFYPFRWTQKHYICLVLSFILNSFNKYMLCCYTNSVGKTKVGGFCPLPSQIRDYWLEDFVFTTTHHCLTLEKVDLVSGCYKRKTLIHHIFQWKVHFLTYVWNPTKWCKLHYF